MNRLFILTACASAALMCGCSNDELANVETSTQDMIGFHVVGNRAETRATPITPDNLNTTDFGVFAFTESGTMFMGKKDNEYNHDGVEIEFNNNQWSYRDPAELRYWPEETTPLDFYAFNPATVSDYMQWFYTLDVNPDEQKIKYTCIDEYGSGGEEKNYDVMYAVAKEQKKSTNYGKVKLQFKHILSQVVFQARTRYENMKVDIKDIKIHNIKFGGTFTLPGTDDRLPRFEDWTLNENTAPAFTVVKDASITVESDTEVTDITSATPMLNVPQTLTEWDVAENSTSKAEADDAKQCYLEINCKIRQNDVYLHGSAEEYKVIYVPFGAEWQPGKRYVYTLVFGGGYDDQGNPILNAITFEPEIEPWGEQSEENAVQIR